MQWFENESFWETFYPFMFGEQRFATAAEQVERVLSLSGIENGAALDLCCGPARHGVLLADKGFAVTAVDRSPFLLSKARDHAAARSIEFVEADMRSFLRPRAFDLAVNLYTSFGYFETQAEDLTVLENVKASLKPGGILIMDVLGKECLASRLPATRWEQTPGRIFIDHAEVLPGWSRIRNRWMLVEGSRAKQFEFDINVYSGQELAGMLMQAGFSEVDLFGSLEGTPYDSKATRLVARALV